MEAPIRVAVVPGATREAVTAYLPSNYRVGALADGDPVVVGRDVAGWTLDGYVLPRLASGLMFGRELHTPDCFVPKES